MKILLSVGHSILKSGKCTSAGGFVNEYQYNKRLSYYLKDSLESFNHEVTLMICPERVFQRTYEERLYKLKVANSQNFDLIIELHLNAFNSKVQGCECYYYKGDRKGKEFATNCCKALESLGFKNRSVKTKNLYMINETYATAILLESFFCDNKADCDLAKSLTYNVIADALAAAISSKSVVQKKKKKCVMYFKKEDLYIAKTISTILCIECFRDNGKDLAKEKYKDYDILYIKNYSKSKSEVYKQALNMYLNTNL